VRECFELELGIVFDVLEEFHTKGVLPSASASYAAPDAQGQPFPQSHIPSLAILRLRVLALLAVPPLFLQNTINESSDSDWALPKGNSVEITW
jgi:hypothetical protein